MTGNATVLTTPTRETAAARARENREYVRSLLKVRQPQFAAALESAAQEFLREHGTGRRRRPGNEPRLSADGRSAPRHS
jgi:hypothetical protein